MYSPYDFNQSIAHRAEYVEERLKGGSPVVGLSYDQGALLFTVRRGQRKLFEIYDQIMYAAVGQQADMEAVRLASIDFAHQEGFVRSPDDVSLQRMVGFAISPPLKRSFGDPMSTPNVLRALFVEIDKKADLDSYFVLNYDGEFEVRHRFSAIAGSDAAEEAMLQELDRSTDTPDLHTCLERAAKAWRAGQARRSGNEGAPEKTAEGGADQPVADALVEALAHGVIEAAVLERSTARESRFRLLEEHEFAFLKEAAGPQSV